MKSRHDSRCWADDGSDVPAFVRETLRDARAEAPTDAQMERVIARIETALSGAPGPAPEPRVSAPGADAVARSSLAGNGLKLTGLAVVLGVAGYLVTHDAARTRSPAVRARAARETHAPAPVRPAAMQNPSASPILPMSQPHSPVAKPTAAARNAPAGVRRRHPLPRATAAAERNAADATDELELVRTARHVLARAPGQALFLLEQHRQRYPRGQFIEEREALAIEALLLLGRTAQARARAQTFQQRHPRSAYERRLRELLQSEPAHE